MAPPQTATSAINKIAYTSATMTVTISLVLDARAGAVARATSSVSPPIAAEPRIQATIAAPSLAPATQLEPCGPTGRSSLIWPASEAGA